MRGLALGLLATAFGLAAWIGWWTVPVVGLLWGLWPAGGTGPRRVAGEAALAATLGFGLWLGYDAVGGSGLGELGPRLAGVMGVPLLVLFAVTLLLAGGLAGSGAVLGDRLRRAVRPRPGPAERHPGAG